MVPILWLSHPVIKTVILIINHISYRKAHVRMDDMSSEVASHMILHFIIDVFGIFCFSLNVFDNLIYFVPKFLLSI